MNLDFDYKAIDTTPPSVNIDQKLHMESKGGIGALTPAMSVLVTPKISLGVAVNFYTDEFFGDYAWKQTTKSTTNIASKALGNLTIADSYNTTFKNFQGINATFGLLWDVWEKEDKLLTFGAVYDTPYTADVDRISSESITNPHSREHFEIDHPMSLGVGLGFRYTDALSFSLDVTWTDWSVYQQERTEDGLKTRPLGGASLDREIDDTYAVRCGAEYLIFGQKVIIPVRGGLFYDPRPSLGSPTNVYGFSVGSGITFKRFSIDGAYQFRWSGNADGEDFGLPSGTTLDFTDHMFLTSLIIYF